jgi:hypothetical protein
MNAHVKPGQAAHHSEWVLARARSMSAGLRLVQFEIDEIGISLKNGWITPEQAAYDLRLLERLPVYLAPIFLTGADE